jgi:hypothetical protein
MAWTTWDGDFAIFTRSISSVAAAIGSGSSARLYRGDAKQGQSVPFVVWQLVSSDTYLHHAGYNNLHQEVIHVYCVAASPDAADALANAIRDAWRAVGRQTVGATWVESCFASIADTAEEGAIDAGEALYWSRVVLRIARS